VKKPKKPKKPKKTEKTEKTKKTKKKTKKPKNSKANEKNEIVEEFSLEPGAFWCTILKGKTKASTSVYVRLKSLI